MDDFLEHPDLPIFIGLIKCVLIKSVPSCVPQVVQEFEEREQRVATLQEEVSVCSINCKDVHWWSHSQTPYLVVSFPDPILGGLVPRPHTWWSHSQTHTRAEWVG